MTVNNELEGMWKEAVNSWCPSQDVNQTPPECITAWANFLDCIVS
jgi:hypothetical protein